MTYKFTYNLESPYRSSCRETSPAVLGRLKESVVFGSSLT
jgi:hypothetical protein